MKLFHLKTLPLKNHVFIFDKQSISITASEALYDKKLYIYIDIKLKGKTISVVDSINERSS